MTTSDMLTHSWILTEDELNNGANNKKKKSMPLGGESNSANSIKLSLKELLNVSSDWKEVNKKNLASGSSSTTSAGALPMDF